MNFKEIEKLIELFSQNDISKMSLKQADFEIKFEKKTESEAPQMLLPSTHTPAVSLPAVSTPAPTQTPTTQASQEGTFIESPMVGTFYHCPSPDAAPYVKVGEKIKKGQVIGIVEAMKIMNEIEADFDCEILEVLTGDAQPVEFGSKLIKIKKI